MEYLAGALIFGFFVFLVVKIKKANARRSEPTEGKIPGGGTGAGGPGEQHEK